MSQSRVQTNRLATAGTRPATSARKQGELYVNFADFQAGFIDASQAPQDLVGVRFFSTGGGYNIGDFVVQGGQLYRAKAASAPGAFVAGNWSKLVNVDDLSGSGFGTMALQNATAVAITGGSIDGTVIGQTTRVAGYFSGVGIGTSSPRSALELSQSGQSQIAWTDLSQGVDGKTYDFMNGGGVFYGRLINDAYTASASWVQVARTGMTVGQVLFPAAAGINVAGNVAMNGANANINILPTGTGTVTIKPTVVGSIDNVKIGATTPAASTFTTTTITGTLTANTLTTASTVNFSGITNFAIGYGGGANFTTGTTSFNFLFSGTTWYSWTNVAYSPAIDNQCYLGISTNRWIQVWAVNGTIATSDEREKHDIRSLDEKEVAVAKRLKKLLVMYKWNDEKIGNGKWHCGIVAQRVKEAFEAESLDANAYAMWREDELGPWHEAENDEDGKEIKPRWLEKNGKTRFSVDYSQVLAFIIAAM